VHRKLRAETKFILIGWVLMPKHFHVLLRASDQMPQVSKDLRQPS